MQDLKDQIDKQRLPVHIAVIMDGNGRWAKQRGFVRTRGHERGVDAVRNTVEAAAELGVRYLTLYAFSTENWNRPQYEVDALMRILVRSLDREMKTLMENNISLRAIGDLKSLPARSQRTFLNAIGKTSGNTGLTLILALSYSSRWELTEVVRSIAGKVLSGEILPGQVDISTVTSALATAGIPDPELLIRTSGEYRISNFLLWQIAYTELYFTSTLWPDFGKEDLYKAILDFQRRERRFGLTSEQINEVERKKRK
jgi:undecaprenyl diphosphate synthase